MGRDYSEMEKEELIDAFARLCAQRGQASMCIDPADYNRGQQVLAMKEELLRRLS